MYLGIEIGGTKLQLALGAGDGSSLVQLRRTTVEPGWDAERILAWIEAQAKELIAAQPVRGAGIGFGGPVDATAGRVVKSHHVAGWDGCDLADWCRRKLELPCTLANDADTAGVAEARFGAGRGCNPVLYVTVGTGIGGGLILDGRIYSGHGGAAAEIGHLRPGLAAERPGEILEALASGWGIAAEAAGRLSAPIAHRLPPRDQGQPKARPEELRQHLIEEEEAAEQHAADLLERCGGDVDALSAKMVAAAAADGNLLAEEIMERATAALGWGIAQAVTLLAPEVVVVGGGVSLAGEELFFAPLRAAAARYVFPPLADRYRIAPAALREEVVLHGALALAADA